MLNKIGFGTYKLLNSECEIAVLNAYKCGYRTFDTAELYKNHEYIGKLLKENIINREEIFLISKIHFKNIKNKNVFNATLNIIKELHIKYLDLILLHAPIKKDIDIYAWNELIKLKKECYVRNIGVSNYGIKDLDNIIKNTNVIPYLNQIEVNPYNTRTELINYCKDKNIIVQAHSLLKGIRFDEEIITILSKKYGITNAQLIIKWALQNDLYCVIKSSNIDHIKENIDVMNMNNEISKEDMEKINKLNKDFYLYPRYK